MRVLERARELEELIRVACGVDSAVQDGIVAGTFALVAQARGSEPHQRMKPVNGTDQLGADLQEPVVAGDVGEFVSEHGSATLHRPFRRAGGKQDARAE